MYQGKFNPDSGKPAKGAGLALSKGTIVFYSIFLAVVLAMIIGIIVGIGALTDWLEDFEASQSTGASQVVFQEYFADPDWAALYTQTQQADGKYDGKDQFAAYMEKRTEGKALTMSKTSTGTDKTLEKYQIRLENEVLGHFYLKNTSQTEMPHWELDKIELDISRQETVTVSVIPGCSVYLNGILMDDGKLIQSTSTVAEEYLKKLSSKYNLPNLTGYRMETYTTSGLLTQPEVTVKDASGNLQQVIYNSEKNTFAQVPAAMEPSQGVKDTVIAAAKAFSRYMLAEESVAGMKQYFDASSDAYTSLPPTWELWVQDNRGYVFSEPVLSDYYVYSDRQYSIRVTMNVTVTRMDHTTKDYPMDTTFFFYQNSAGKWLVNEKTNEEVQKQLSSVLLTYMDGTQVLQSDFVSSTAKLLTPPAVEVPEGKVFLGWFTKSVAENGQITMTKVFAPDESGQVHLTGSQPLEPMVLYPRFEEDKGE